MKSSQEMGKVCEEITSDIVIWISFTPSFQPVTFNQLQCNCMVSAAVCGHSAFDIRWQHMARKWAKVFTLQWNCINKKWSVLTEGLYQKAHESEFTAHCYEILSSSINFNLTTSCTWRHLLWAMWCSIQSHNQYMLSLYKVIIIACCPTSCCSQCPS